MLYDSFDNDIIDPEKWDETTSRDPWYNHGGRARFGSQDGGGSGVLYTNAWSGLDADSSCRIQQNGNGEMSFLTRVSGAVSPYEPETGISFDVSFSVESYSLSVLPLRPDIEESNSLYFQHHNYPYGGMTSEFFVRFATTGVNPTRYQFKLWYSGWAEPDEWLVDLTQNDPALEVMSSGAAGVSAYRPNAYEYAYFDYFTVTDPRPFPYVKRTASAENRTDTSSQENKRSASTAVKGTQS